MSIVKKQWSSGTGEVTINYNGSGNGQITISSDGNNLYEARTMQIVVQTTAGSPQQTKTVNISQAARARTDISNAVVTAANQTYNGSVKTPAPTVVLNGTTIPSTGYDVTYSNNTNAGTATVTVTGKGDYTGTASGTFTIAQATGQVTTAPTARSVTYSGSAQYLVVAGSGTGTMQYRYKLDSASSWSFWSTTRARATNAGTYNVQYRAAASSDGNYTVSAVGELNVTMAKRTPVVNVAPTIVTGLVYTGSAQNLLTGGSMKHSSSNSNAVAGTFTYKQGINAGTYSSLTWSFAPTDSTNYNSASGTVTGSVSIAKASRTLSFPNAYVVLAPSGNITKTATPSAGSGDGSITYSIGSTTYATINSSSGKVTAKTTEGNTTVTATIAEGTNYLGATATYTLYVFATTHNYSYSGSTSSLTLPPGTYKLQCWGAQGGSNAADADYGITAQAGGKGGYSEGQLTVASATAVKVYVGGQGTSSDGGYNGGGSTPGSSYRKVDLIEGVCKMAGGGGATDIRLSDGALLSRMIVAGGGSGGVMSCKRTYTQTGTEWVTEEIYTRNSSSSGYLTIAGSPKQVDGHIYNATITSGSATILNGLYSGGSYLYALGTEVYDSSKANSEQHLYINVSNPNGTAWTAVTTDKYEQPVYTHTDETYSKVGFAGGGTTGKGYTTNYTGKQDAAGTNGAFGQGANQPNSSNNFVSAGGGGGWYGGGGGEYGSSYYSTSYCSGGGSGFVNTSANAQYRPSGYTGLQLDSGTTKDGTQTFVSPSGTNETGHSGNGYAKITRL